jgi:hypothetical protein
MMSLFTDKYGKPTLVPSPHTKGKWYCGVNITQSKMACAHVTAKVGTIIGPYGSGPTKKAAYDKWMRAVCPSYRTRPGATPSSRSYMGPNHPASGYHDWRRV